MKIKSILDRESDKRWLLLLLLVVVAGCESLSFAFYLQACQETGQQGGNQLLSAYHYGDRSHWYLFFLDLDLDTGICCYKFVDVLRTRSCVNLRAHGRVNVVQLLV